jgi:hypothetical protein
MSCAGLIVATEKRNLASGARVAPDWSNQRRQLCGSHVANIAYARFTPGLGVQVGRI